MILASLCRALIASLAGALYVVLKLGRPSWPRIDPTGSRTAPKRLTTMSILVLASSRSAVGIGVGAGVGASVGDAEGVAALVTGAALVTVNEAWARAAGPAARATCRPGVVLCGM